MLPKEIGHLGQGIESFLSRRFENAPPAFVVMDVMMNWSKHIFKKANIPLAPTQLPAMEYVAWNAGVDDMPGLPESMAMRYSETRRQDRRQHEQSDGGRIVHQPSWVDETEGSTALLINTCEGLESPFLMYLTGQVEKPVFGVGPLLPGTFWESIGSVMHDRDSRPRRETNYTEDEVIQWLDSKPGGSSSTCRLVARWARLWRSMMSWQRHWRRRRSRVIQPGAGRSSPPANFFGGRAVGKIT
ncbi:mogroside IE synthase-like [Salvia splendens]|uniref:mogroside IE synthase-like n=1 Tax=Salvia splendens TaxID=180675 RepID=UPI001C27BCA7|nr:mogroside IE synthase-like [Salvia splendens]